METIGAFDAKTHFSALLEKVQHGEQIVITKHGHPIAKIIPANSYDREKIRAAIKRMEENSQHHFLNGLDWKALRDEGRR